MLSEQDKRLVIDSWRLVQPIADTASELFYRRLFELRPSYRAMFPSDMGPQKRKLIGMLGFIVKALDWSVASDWQEEISDKNDLLMVVLALGRRHGALYRVPDESYAVVGEALLWTLDYGLGDAFSEDVCSAWTRVYQSVAAMMLMGTKGGQLPCHH